MAHASNPYGDGTASKKNMRIPIGIILKLLIGGQLIWRI